ncbi:MAG: FHA domain-containing protein [Labilithrix sp.]|nr:FHA domain-containing protein [Labilithrix sp.]MCW5815645.1 FHA domain-containing protein [Labilithrix sp.]
MPLTLHTWLDRSSLRPAGESRLSAVFEIVSHGAAVEGARPRSRTVLALDVSLSMKGAPIAQVIRSVDRLLDALGPEDEVGIVAFSERAVRVVDPVKVDAHGKRLVRSRVGRLTVLSGTNIEAGLEASAAMLASTPSGMRKGVVLLSDGAPNVGAHTAEALREVVRKHKPGISFFALGYGPDHSEDVLSAIGDGYEFVPDPATCARAFARALGAQGDVVASDVELVVAPSSGVEISRFLASERLRFGKEGAVLSLPDMVAGVRRFVVVELRVRGPGGDTFATTLLDVTARCRESGAVSESLTIEVADREPAVVVEAARHALLVHAELARDEARALADRGQFTGAAATLRKIMTEIAALPGWIANDGTPLAEAYELLVDEVMVYERRPDPEVYAMYRKSTMGSRVATVAPVSSKLRGDASSKLIEHIAGDMPIAWLLDPNGVRHRLQEECVIGRTADADITIASASVSRRHAEVFANAGDFWLADMGSTNTTKVNGMKLDRAPHKLTPNDVIHIGDVELRYVEDPRKVTD